MNNLTPFLCSIHTHTAFCDGKNTMEEMAEAAYKAGVRYYGVSGHSHTPVPQDKDFVLPYDMTDYRKKAMELREQYLGKMEVLLGLEWDICSDAVHDGFDYWIGSVHYLQPENDRYYPVDLSEDIFEKCQDEGFNGNIKDMVQMYFEQVSRMAALNPPVLGHMDLITKFNERNRFFDETAEWYRETALQALHTVSPSKTVLEINTGAMARGYRKTPYPALFLLKEWHDMGGRIIVTADAHTAEGIVYGYNQAVSLAKEAGFKQAVVLTGKGFVECSL